MIIPRRMYVNVVWLITAFAAVSGCAVFGAGSAIDIAETAAQKGHAIEGSYNILLEDLLAVGSAPSTSQSVKDAIQRAEATTTPVIDSMSDALAEVDVERARFDAAVIAAEAAGAGGSQDAAKAAALARLTVVTQNLDGWIAKAQVALVSLHDALKKPTP